MSFHLHLPSALTSPSSPISPQRHWGYGGGTSTTSSLLGGSWDHIQAVRLKSEHLYLLCWLPDSKSLLFNFGPHWNVGTRKLNDSFCLLKTFYLFVLLCVAQDAPNLTKQFCFRFSGKWDYTCALLCPSRTTFYKQCIMKSGVYIKWNAIQLQGKIKSQNFQKYW